MNVDKFVSWRRRAKVIPGRRSSDGAWVSAQTRKVPFQERMPGDVNPLGRATEPTTIRKEKAMTVIFHAALGRFAISVAVLI
jgi:hypothetical protein